MKNKFVLFAPVLLIMVAAILLSNRKADDKIAEQQYFPEDDTTIVMPEQPATFPALLVKTGEDEASLPLRMNELKIDVKVIGNIATTTMEMNFYNDLDRVLEGQLYFPLGEGQTISHFAMEVDGKLRDGVVVEKEKGRQTFESVVRRKIDPGLLEWTKGNNFKARVYPIPAKGNKRIVISYSQELVAGNQGDIYILPLQFKDKVDLFKLDIEVMKQEVKPQLEENDLINIKFEKWHESYIAGLEKTNYLPDHQLVFSVPNNESKRNVYVEKNNRNSSGDYFYINLQPEKMLQKKSLPGKICLVWDVSGSAKSKNIEKELNVLDSYFSAIGTLEVELVTFSNDIHSNKKYNIVNGNWDDLKKSITGLKYDGGTQLGILDLNKLSCDEIILSTDGLSNFGDNEVKTGKIPVITICSGQSADYSYLKYISAKTNGEFLNLTKMTEAEIMKAMTSNPYKFISAGFNNDEITEVYPNIPCSFKRNFSVAGLLKTDKAEITLNFGTGNEIHNSVTIIISRESIIEGTGMIERMWASKKLTALDMNYDNHEDEITALGKEYGIVTRNTSLIVLDRIEDYVEHEIIPPVEMQEAYFAQIESMQKEKEEKRLSHLEEVVAAFDARYTWWNTVYMPKKQKSGNLPDTVYYDPDGDVIEENYNSPRESVNEINDRADNYSEEQSVNNSSVGNYSVTIQDANGASDHSNQQLMGKLKDKEEKELLSTITLNKWDPETPYMNALKEAPKDKKYEKYLELKSENENTPSFYLDVSDYFAGLGEKEIAIRILSNISELELENHQLMRILGHRLEQLGYYKLSISVFSEVLKIRGEEPQSYRDLGLVYARDKQYQKAVDYLYEVVTGTWDSRFPEIEVIAACEMNAVIGRCGKTLDLKKIDERLLKAMPVDIRIVIDWDTDNCDMDLWVTDPRNEKCDYSHNRTEIGGYISRDFTGGYGPEEFLLKKAIAGNYTIEVNYYGSTQQTLTGPTTVMAKLYTNFGSENQKMEEITLRLASSKEVITIGTLKFGE